GASRHPHCPQRPRPSGDPPARYSLTVNLDRRRSSTTIRTTSWPKIAAFLSGLPDDVRADRDRVCGVIDPKSGYYVGAWLERLRNVTFHYADVHPQKSQAKTEEVERALARAIAQEIKGKITMATDSFGDVRFEFADEVAV
ncbi:MAG: hypothetical protein LC777_03670, partial [Actinobacteria bacterium]|nr:hypothetical protein [Actinomycetota bacterium]